MGKEQQKFQIMAGSLVSIDQPSNDQAMAINAILDQWEVQYTRFVHFPPLSSSSSVSAAAITTHHQSLLIPRSDRSRKIRRGGVWFSSSSSAAAAASAAATASLKLIAVGSDDVILNLSLHCKILEEHRISKLHFTWPQVSCVSGFPARGARAIFVSYKDSLGQIQKFALRFLTIYEAEKFIDVLQEILYNVPDNLQGAEFNSELSSQSEFVPSVGLPYRAEEGCSHTTTADTSTLQGTTSLNCEIDKYSNAQESIQNPEAGEFLCDFPPSFTSFLKNCCPAAEKTQASAPEEIDLKTQIARYLEDSSFQDMLVKVEKVINELGDDIIM